MVPMLSAVNTFIPWLLIIGVFALQFSILPLAAGVVLFSLTTLFSFITLPVEFDASNRALAFVKRRGVVTTSEYAMAKDALWWAASTYVIAAIGSLVTLLYYVMILLGSRRNS
jgi:Zn-dependent membrane protease YugP